MGVEVEAQDTTHVKVGVRDGGDAGEMALIELIGGFGDDGIDSSGVPEYNQIGNQRQRAGDRYKLLG